MKDLRPNNQGLEQGPELNEEFATGYVLGSLSEAERTEVERRLEAGDTALAAEIAAAQEGLTCFALGVPAVEPAPEVKARLFARLAAEAAQPAVESTPDPLSYRASMDVDDDLQALSRFMNLALGRLPPPPPRAPARKAILVIDMLHDYVDDGAPMETPLARAIVPDLRRLLEQERSHGTPIIYINDRHAEDDPDFDVWPKHAVRGTPGAEIIAALRPTPQDFHVDRVSYSAFFETDLEPLLERLGVTDLVLTGQAADACVMMTGVDALMRGYRIEVPEDCVAGTTQEGKVFALRRLALLKPYQGKRRR
jgi:nicotinamidase-related amidase